MEAYRHLLRLLQSPEGRTDACRERRVHLIRVPRRPEKAPAIRITVGLQGRRNWRDYFYWSKAWTRAPAALAAKLTVRPPGDSRVL